MAEKEDPERRIVVVSCDSEQVEAALVVDVAYRHGARVIATFPAPAR